MCRRLKTVAPITSAKKKSFLSAPNRVSGVLSERKTGLSLFGMRESLCSVGQAFLRSGKQPCHEVHGANGHADAKDHARQGALGSAFAECKHEAPDDNCD
jgi:hypothetical protein